MIKLIAFDLDGVLVDTKKIHYESLNLALKYFDESYVINWDEHIGTYDGLKTEQKLKILSAKKNIPENLHSKIWEKKQALTQSMLSKLDKNKNLQEILMSLSKRYKIACCSNSIKNTVEISLLKLGVRNLFDFVISNEDIKNSKPHPEVYWNAMSMANSLPEETLIIEDSPVGLLSAHRSNSHVLRVESSNDLNLEKIEAKIKEINLRKNNYPKWSNKKLNVLIPMAGAGSRFEKAGYDLPKPLIEINKKSMIQIVVENLNIDANYTYVVQKSHREKFNLDNVLNKITPGCNIVETDGVTEGAACTALLAKKIIDNENPLFFANSDQYVEWNSNEFLYKMQETQVDGGIVTFKAFHPKWSFVKINKEGFVVEVAEKKPISDIATVGYYYWKRGRDFVEFAEEMINKNIRVNNEFYVCPVFNQAIEKNKKIITYEAKQMWGLGTPEDLEIFLDNLKNNDFYFA